MPRWSIDIIRKVDFIRKRIEHLGTVEAPDERTAIDNTAELFNIGPARRNRIIVTKISTRDGR